LRESDSITRYGGEEFAVIFNRATVPEVHRALTQLRRAIARTEFESPAGRLRVTISIGSAQVMGDENQESIVQRADAALYASKKAGRNCGHWHDGQRIVPILDAGEKPISTPVELPKAAEAPIPAEPLAVGEPIGGDQSIGEQADDLPALLNRTAFGQHLRSRMAEWKRGGPTLTLILAEIDQFESHTRCHGTKLRDLLMMSLARVVFAGVREMDMVARYSSSCLAFLLPKAQLFDAIRVADRIREAATQVAIKAGETKVGFTVSIGLIQVGSADDMAALFRKAEMALVAGHQRGGNCLIHHDGVQCKLAAPTADTMP
jgi:diguanylate cyclase